MENATPEQGRHDLSTAIKRGDRESIDRIADRLDRIEIRLSRIEGGLILGGFAITIAAAILGKVL